MEAFVRNSTGKGFVAICGPCMNFTTFRISLQDTKEYLNQRGT